MTRTALSLMLTILASALFIGCGGDDDGGGSTTTAASVLSADQRAEIEALLVETQTHSDPAHCTEVYTDRLVANGGGLSRCRKIERQGGGPDSVEVVSVVGNDDGTATARMIAHGGNFDGVTSTAGLVYEDGGWKLDDFTLDQQPTQ